MFDREHSRLIRVLAGTESHSSDFTREGVEPPKSEREGIDLLDLLGTESHSTPDIALVE